MMEVKVGGYYRRRDGRVSSLLNDGGFTVCMDSLEECCWNRHGRTFDYKTGRWATPKKETPQKTLEERVAKLEKKLCG